MTKITKEQYEFARERIEELLPIVDGYDLNDRNAVERSVLSDIVIEYEKEYFPIEKPTPAELIAAGLDEKGLTQKQLAEKIGISQSRVSEYISGKAEPSLKTARQLCRILGIKPAEMLGI